MLVLPYLSHVMVMMQQVMGDKADDKPKGRFHYALKARSHGKRIRHLRGKRPAYSRKDSRAVFVGLNS